MSVPLTSENFADVLDTRFRSIFDGRYPKKQSRIPDFFDVVDSTMADERFSELTDFGKLQQFTGALGYTGSEQGYDVTATHIEYALGVQIRRKLYDDDQFGVIDSEFEKLVDSAFHTHEDHAAGIFNDAFSSSNTFFSHSEGVALCSDSHTTPVSGVSTTTGFDNRGTSALSPAALTAAIITFRQYKSPAGYYQDNTPTDLVVPINLLDTATEIVKTTKGLDNAEGTINVHEGRFKVTDWVRLTDTNNWFLIDMAGMKENVKWFWRVRPETAKMESFDNLVAKGRIYTRYSFLRQNWRFIFGSECS